jgi:hypothetical protein
MRVPSGRAAAPISNLVRLPCLVAADVRRLKLFSVFRVRLSGGCAIGPDAPIREIGAPQYPGLP